MPALAIMATAVRRDERCGLGHYAWRRVEQMFGPEYAAQLRAYLMRTAR